MDGAPLRVGLVAEGFKSGTGPATYCEALSKALSGRHYLCGVSGACGREVDLVHLVDAKRTSPRLAERLGVPVVADFHDHYWTGFVPYPSPDLPLRGLRQKQLKRHHLELIMTAAAVVVHSRAVREAVAAALDEAGLQKPLFHVPYALDADEFERPGRPEPPREPPLVLMVGRDMWRKGFHTAVGALGLLIKERGPAELVVIGDDYPHARLAARIFARGLSVRFMPEKTRTELMEWYNRASVLILPSFREAFGLVLLEAMAAGLPAVASDTGGIPEAVEHEVSGLLHKPGDHRGLARSLIRVLDEPGLREALVKGGRQRAREFSFHRMADSLDSVYRSAVEAR